MNYSEIFTETGAFIAAILFLTEWIKSTFNVSGNYSQYLSWAIGIILAAVGNVFNLGMFAEFDWTVTLVMGFLAALSSNGLFDTGFVDWIVGLFKKRKIE
jgi:hypothetical protein